MMASIQTLLRNLLQREEIDLADLISDLNHTLYVSSTDARYSTLFCGVISAGPDDDDVCERGSCAADDPAERWVDWTG